MVMAMRYIFITLFVDRIAPFFDNEIIRSARQRGLVDIEIVDLRIYGIGRHRQCDDAPYGGGGGMLLMAEPLRAALDAVDGAHRCVLYPSPSGMRFTSQSIPRLLREETIIFICGHYEGIDQRIIDRYVDYEVSIGEYVISSGELASLVIAETLIRRVDGVINERSLREESYEHGLLEYPHYTRPAVWDGMRAPDVLLSGNHAKIAAWRRAQSEQRTRQNKDAMLQ